MVVLRCINQHSLVDPMDIFVTSDENVTVMNQSVDNDFTLGVDNRNLARHILPVTLIKLTVNCNILSNLTIGPLRVESTRFLKILSVINLQNEGVLLKSLLSEVVEVCLKKGLGIKLIALTLFSEYLLKLIILALPS